MKNSVAYLSVLLAVCTVVLGSPIHHQNGPEPNSPENIALIASGKHLQKIEELSGQFEGDIVLTDLQKQAINGHLRNGLINTTYRWENNIVPYNFTADLNEVQRAEVLKGLRAIEAAAPCISFVQRTIEEHYVEVHVSQVTFNLEINLYLSFMNREIRPDAGRWSAESAANRTSTYS